MVDYILVTTLEKKLYDNPENTVFLGEWVRDNLSESHKEFSNCQVLDYHWNDKTKFNKDYHYLNDLYETILVSLSNSLNAIHEINKPIRYWRILIGPWLQDFIQICFDRWEMIGVAGNNPKIKITKIISIDESSIIPIDFAQLRSFECGDKWNHWIYGEVIKYRNYFKIYELNSDEFFTEDKILSKSNNKFFFDQVLMFFKKFFFKKITFNKKYFIHSSQFSRFKKLFLELLLLEFPSLNGSYNNSMNTINQNQRSQILFNKGNNDFESFLKKMIPKQIPFSYMEGFNELQKESKTMPWPFNPKIILTTGGCYFDELFKIWAAEKTSKGSLLFCAQHGGHYGTGLISTPEKHERNISDKFLSWGWNGENVKPLASPKLSGLNTRTNLINNGCCVLIQNVTPRYSYSMFSSVVSSMQVEYLKQQFQFVESLSRTVKKDLVVRLFPSDFGWMQRQKWNHKFPGVILDNSIPYLDQINSAKLVIATYNATTFLETLSANIPTLIFWDESHWEVNKESKYYFKILKNAGILHPNPESASRQLNSIWSDVDAWWNSEKVKSAINIFCSKYAKKSDKCVKDWAHYLSENY
jgi:putative transferase (TIGR04331 family)